MNKLKYEQAVAENCKRVVARKNVTNEVQSSKTQLIRDKFEMERRAASKTAASKAGAQRDLAVNSNKKSGCQSNFDAVKSSRPAIRRTASATKIKTMSIPVRQVSHETAMIKIPEKNSEVFPKELAKYTTPTIISKPEINESDTSPHDYDECIQNDQLDDEPNLKDNGLMEQLPEVDINHDSREVGDDNPYFETEEPIKNDTCVDTEHVDEDTPHVLKLSDETLISEPEHDLVTSCLEAESIVQMEEPQDPIVAEFLEENIENSELQIPSSNNAVPVLDSNQEKMESTKFLRAHFEALQNKPPTDKPTSKSNINPRQFNCQVIIKCELCEKRVYPMEKIEIESRVYHKTCFRCSHCQCILRMDSFTKNRNRLYCVPHFKQLFKISGNYEQGFSDA